MQSTEEPPALCSLEPSLRGQGVLEGAGDSLLLGGRGRTPAVPSSPPLPPPASWGKSLQTRKQDVSTERLALEEPVLTIAASSAREAPLPATGSRG